jgi:putative DNA primase/helicase
MGRPGGAWVTAPAVVTHAMLDAAVACAALGLHVFPVYGIRAGVCACPAGANCPSPAKHPMLKAWQREATLDLTRLKEWWTKWPNANIGMALQVGQCVLDVDDGKGGPDTLATLEADFGALPRTREVSTGGGGRHIYLAGDLRNTAGQLGPGLDTRGSGGYVVGPGSMHVSGRAYAWDANGDPSEVTLSPVPGWLVGLLTPDEAHVAGASAPVEGIAAKAFAWAIRRAKAGRPRNETGFALGCQLRDNGVLLADAEPLMRQFAAEVGGLGDHPYAVDEALHSLRQAYSKPAREPWPEPVEVRVGRPVGVPRLEPRAFTDLGNAERFADDHGGQVLYVHPWGQWLLWDGKVWGHDVDGGVIRRAKETVRRIWDEAIRLDDSRQKEAAAKHALKSESAGKVEAMLQLGRCEQAIVAAPDDLDADPWVLNCKNGILDLHTGVLGAHNPEQLCTRQVEAEYLPEALCPRWDAFLARVVPPDIADFLQRAVGYSLTGSTQEQCLFVNWGTGANGKTVMMETLSTLWGSYGEQAEAKSFVERKTEQISNDLARLKGARLVVATETEQGARLAEALVKSVTGGDRITARFLRQEFFTFTPIFKLFLSTNSKPTIRGTDNGIWRRIRLIPWEVTIPLEERDQGLTLALRDELPGILAWAVRGCLEWQKGGLNPPSRVIQATDDYRDEMDSLGGFLADECERIRGWSVPMRDLFREYTKWAESEHERPMGQKNFSMSLQERGFKIAREGHNNVRSVAGLKLRPDATVSGSSSLERIKSPTDSTPGRIRSRGKCVEHESFTLVDEQRICDACEEAF